MKIGIMGINHLGKSLIKSFLTTQTFLPTEIIVYDPHKEKADSVTSDYPGIFAAQTSREFIQEVSCFFLCINEHEYQIIKNEIQPEVKSSQVLISLIPSINISELEADLPCKTAKILTDSHLSKVNSLYTGSRMSLMEQRWLRELFSTITYPRKIITFS